MDRFPKQSDNPPFGLLGRKLGHSWSPRIHALMGSAPYGLFEREPEDVERFLREEPWRGVNVTIPYKQAVIRYLDRLEGDAAQIRAVNTVVNRGGELVGYNTDVAGARYMLRSLGVRTEGAKAAVLGSGGAARAVSQALMQLGAEPFLVSRWPQKALEFGSVRRAADDPSADAYTADCFCLVANAYLAKFDPYFER
jgi:shikimate dehydrogenase